MKRYLVALALAFGLVGPALAAPPQYGTATHLAQYEVTVPAATVTPLTPGTTTRNFLSLTERSGGGACNVVYETQPTNYGTFVPSASFGDPFVATQSRTFESNAAPVGKPAVYCAAAAVFSVMEGDPQ